MTLIGAGLEYPGHHWCLAGRWCWTPPLSCRDSPIGRGAATG